MKTIILLLPLVAPSGIMVTQYFPTGQKRYHVGRLMRENKVPTPSESLDEKSPRLLLLANSSSIVWNEIVDNFRTVQHFGIVRQTVVSDIIHPTAVFGQETFFQDVNMRILPWIYARPILSDVFDDGGNNRFEVWIAPTYWRSRGGKSHLTVGFPFV